ncbi:probable translation initiation factor 3 (eIF-3) zeta subunit [Rhynchosporium agropyri]|uniref:tRNA (adenine(58)-N(1))-methyltransferase non-catalytic subunit TRM6 n=1 Tax=Rhynchosporium agropyri TaxID=914238 RepID=A0A1E1LLH8_9HELO|nr:probable translation initiation factor 3 (eIF-3) zeta subunit [Rhynchosporium agropyri]
MHALVEPNAWVVLRLPSDTLKILQIAPNTIVSLGKYGTFSSNLLLGRPYNKTYELLDRTAGQKDSDLRIVPASELHADTIAEEVAAAKQASGTGKEGEENVVIGGDGVEFQLVGENGEVIMRSNRETIDDAAQQTLTMTEIEELKREGTGAGKDLIAKLMASHLGIEQKTAFSLAKYKLTKTKKYLRRFTVLPVDVPMLIRWVMGEKDAGRIMEMREEMCALVGSWANVHWAEAIDGISSGGRWLVIDETGGLLVAALAERMGLLHPEYTTSSPNGTSSNNPAQSTEGEHPEIEGESTKPAYTERPLATSNTITLIHNNAQPNLSLLKYFSYDPTTSTPTNPDHPLSTHLHPISWLQLISPSEDTTYSTSIPPLSPSTLSTLKSGKRGTYYRKQRRHNKIKQIVDSTLDGGFDGLVIASHMDPVSILRHTIPLLRGGATIAIYAPTIEPLVTLSDAYSTSRRTAFIQAPPESFLSLPPESSLHWPGDEDFPLNPTLLLNTAVQSARIREWQVLPGRTHPVMTGKGGAEGYLFTGVRVIPAQGRVEARGKFARKKNNTGTKGLSEENGEDASLRSAVEVEAVVANGEKRGLDESESESAVKASKRAKLDDELVV